MSLIEKYKSIRHRSFATTVLGVRVKLVDSTTARTSRPGSVKMNDNHDIVVSKKRLNDSFELSFANLSPHWRAVESNPAQIETSDNRTVVMIPTEFVVIVETSRFMIGGVSFLGTCAPVSVCGMGGFIGSTGEAYDCGMTNQHHLMSPRVVRLAADVWYSIIDGVIDDAVVAVNRHSFNHAGKAGRLVLPRLGAYTATAFALTMNDRDLHLPTEPDDYPPLVYSFNAVSRVVESLEVDQPGEIIESNKVFVPFYNAEAVIITMLDEYLTSFLSHDELIDLECRSGVSRKKARDEARAGVLTMHSLAVEQGVRHGTVEV